MKLLSIPMSVVVCLAGSLLVGSSASAGDSGVGEFGRAPIGCGPMPFAPMFMPPLSPPFPSLMPAGLRILLYGVDLSDAQIENMNRQRSEFQKHAEPVILELKTNGRALRDLLIHENIDRAQVKQTQAEINSLHAQLLNMFTDHVLSMAEILTPEQRKKMRQNFLRSAIGQLPL